MSIKYENVLGSFADIPNGLSVPDYILLGGGDVIEYGWFDDRNWIDSESWYDGIFYLKGDGLAVYVELPEKAFTSGDILSWSAVLSEDISGTGRHMINQPAGSALRIGKTSSDLWVVNGGTLTVDGVVKSGGDPFDMVVGETHDFELAISGNVTLKFLYAASNDGVSMSNFWPGIIFNVNAAGENIYPVTFSSKGDTVVIDTVGGQNGLVVGAQDDDYVTSLV